MLLSLGYTRHLIYSLLETLSLYEPYAIGTIGT